MSKPERTARERASENELTQERERIREGETGRSSLGSRFPRVVLRQSDIPTPTPTAHTCLVLLSCLSSLLSRTAHTFILNIVHTIQANCSRCNLSHTSMYLYLLIILDTVVVPSKEQRPKNQRTKEPTNQPTKYQMAHQIYTPRLTLKQVLYTTRPSPSNYPMPIIFIYTPYNTQ